MASPDGQIAVELKLLMDAAFKQAREGAAAISKEFAKAGMVNPLSKVADETNKVAASEEKVTRAIKERTRATKALTDQQQRLRDIASGKISPTAAGMQIRDVSGITSIGQSGSVTHPTIKSPGLPSQAFPNLPFGGYSGATNAASGINFKALAPILAAVVGTGVGGPLGGAIAGVLTKMNPAVAAATAAMTALRYAATKVADAFERAAGLYAKNLASGGLGQNYITRQSILASVIGVSEQEIMQYGNQIAVLNEKLALATRTISETQPTLTATAWNFKVLKQDLAAMWAKISEAMAPAINRFLKLIDALVKLSIVSGLATLIGKVFGALITVMTRLAAMGSVVTSAFELMATSIKDTIKNLLVEVHNLIAGTKFGKFFGMKKEDLPGFKDTKEAFKDFKEVLKALTAGDNKYTEQAPAVGVNINRLPASSWERMGMVLGQGGGATNWNQKTAQNTTKLVSLTEKMFNAISGRDTFNSFNNPNAAMP